MQIARREWEPGVLLFDMESDDLRVGVSSGGGTVQRLRVKTPSGGWLDAALGFDAPEDYRRSDACLGATIGPVADRMAFGRCTLDGKTVRLPLNAGPDCMHCGDLGFHRAVWDWATLPDGVRLFKTFEADARGFPGTLCAEVRFRLTGDRTLRLEYEAQCDRETAVSFTNHTYFNLSGGARDCLGHRLTLRAARYAETEREVEPICTGRARPVDGTPLDFRGGALIGDVLRRADFREIAAAGGVDHYFLADGSGLREVAELYDPESGLALACRTDAPGLLVYTGNGLSGARGRGGAVYGRHWGVCLETERFPNAVNLPDRRSQVLLEPGEVYRSVTEFSFEWRTC